MSTSKGCIYVSVSAIMWRSVWLLTRTYLSDVTSTFSKSSMFDIITRGEHFFMPSLKMASTNARWVTTSQSSSHSEDSACIAIEGEDAELDVLRSTIGLNHI